MFWGWWRKDGARSGSARSRRPRGHSSCRPQIEALEDRVAPHGAVKPAPLACATSAGSAIVSTCQHTAAPSPGGVTVDSTTAPSAGKRLFPLGNPILRQGIENGMPPTFNNVLSVISPVPNRAAVSSSGFLNIPPPRIGGVLSGNVGRIGGYAETATDSAPEPRRPFWINFGQASDTAETPATESEEAPPPQQNPPSPMEPEIPQLTRSATAAENDGARQGPPLVIIAEAPPRVCRLEPVIRKLRDIASSDRFQRTAVREQNGPSQLFLAFIVVGWGCAKQRHLRSRAACRARHPAPWSARAPPQ